MSAVQDMEGTLKQFLKMRKTCKSKPIRKEINDLIRGMRQIIREEKAANR